MLASHRAHLRGCDANRYTVRGGQYEWTVPQASEATASSVVVVGFADVDGDGDEDIVSVVSDGAIDGDHDHDGSTASSSTGGNTAPGLSSPSSSSSSPSSSSSSWVVSMSDGGGAFVGARVWWPNAPKGESFAADLNCDGRADAAVYSTYVRHSFAACECYHKHVQPRTPPPPPSHSAFAGNCASSRMLGFISSHTVVQSTVILRVHPLVPHPILRIRLAHAVLHAALAHACSQKRWMDCGHFQCRRRRRQRQRQRRVA
jgi:hypothetical protein